MGKLLEDGLLVNSRWHDSPFAGILLGANNANNGVNMSHPVMVVQVKTNPSADETIGIGTKTYTFKASGAIGDQINIGVVEEVTAANIIIKINADRHNGTGCTAYPMGNAQCILLVDELAELASSAPTFTVDAGKVIVDKAWANTISEAMLDSVSYFKVDNTTDVNTKPITLVERNAGTYQNFLW